MSVLDDLSAAITTVTTGVAASVVRIGRHHGRGTGFVAAPGVVVTNAHNLRDRTTSVTFADGRQEQGEAIGIDAEGDLAALAVDTAGLTALPRVDGGAEPHPGQAVLAAGARPGGGVRVTLGFVTAVGQAFRGPGGAIIADGVEHTAPAGPGSSGGPLLDTAGRLVGIDTHRLGDGFYLAVPATSELESRLAELAEGRSPARVRIGVALTPPQAAARLRAAVGLPPRDGLLVAGVEAASPAEAAGLRQGDLIVAAGGTGLTRPEELRAALAAAAPTGAVSLRVVRHPEELELVVHLPGVGEG